MRAIVLTFFIIIISVTAFTHSKAQSQSNQFTVVLDAGHGGRDPGAISNGFKEKEIALDVALELGKSLEKYKDIKVIYTRKKDVFIPLYKRASIANTADADLFVSIHCNAVKSSKPYGTETWVLGEKNTGRNFEVAKRENEVIFLEDNYEEHYEGFNPSSPESTIAIGIEQEVYIEQSILLARKIEDNFKYKSKRHSRGLKQGSLLVIRNTYMPSVLVELGFISNKNEGTYLNSNKGQSKMSSALKNAILDYKKTLEDNVGKQQVVNTIHKENNITEARVVDGVTFKVQIAASGKNLTTKPYNFKGLKNISKSKEGNLYRYYCGHTSDYNKVLELKTKAKERGYGSAFVVAFKNDKPIPLKEALGSVLN